MPNLAAGFTRLSAISLILFVGLLVTESSTASKTFSVICTAYCDRNGQLMDEFRCSGGDSRRLFSTRTPRIAFCCGNATAKYCCSDPDESSSLGPKIHCDDDDDDDNNINNSDDWVIIVGIIMTAVFLLICLIGSLCLCHRRCQCKNTIYSENGDIIRPHNSRQTSETGQQATTSPDFDPTSPCAFAPPAYDTLAKNPPSYCEIFTIAHTRNDLPPGPPSDSHPSTTLCPEARDAWPDEDEDDEEPTGPPIPPSPQDLGRTEEDNYRIGRRPHHHPHHHHHHRVRENGPTDRPPPPYADDG